MNEPEQNTWRPWRWPMEWFREEKFWRDVGTRTFAGMITAGILYLGALLLGYLGAPHIAGTVAYVLAGALLVALLGFAIRIVVSLPGRRRAGRSLVPSVGLLALTAALVVVIVLLAVIDLTA